MSDIFDRRIPYFQNVDRTEWHSWMWQQQNALRNSLQLKKLFPSFPERESLRAQAWEKNGFRFLLTPYVLALVEKDKDGNPLETDPIWRQVFPVFDMLSQVETPILQKYKKREPKGFSQTLRLASDGSRGSRRVASHVSGKPFGEQQLGGGNVGGTSCSPCGIDEYSPQKENWENSDEMITPIAQHKYRNRVIIYTADACLGYCMYCFRSLQSNAPAEKHGGRPHWNETLEKLRTRPEVEEVILSGGDPLLYDNANVESMLKDLREISSIKAIRIHTRAWLHNPYRIDEEFCRLLKKYRVTEMGVHILHPNEMTSDFQDAVQRIRDSGARTQLMTDTVLVKGINDDSEILHQLFMGLYVSGIKPYYLSHNMPNIPAAASQRTSVRRGLEIYKSLKRHISNVAMPEYIICDRVGKKTVPESLEGAPDFIYDQDENGWPIVRYLDWQERWQVYVDAKD